MRNSKDSFIPGEIHELKFQYQLIEQQKSMLPISHSQVHSMIDRNISHLVDNFRIPLLFYYNLLSEEVQEIPGTVIYPFYGFCLKTLN